MSLQYDEIKVTSAGCCCPVKETEWSRFDFEKESHQR